MDRPTMKDFEFKLEDIERRVSAGNSGDWREISVLAQELIKLKEQVSKLKKKTKKVVDDE